MIDDYTIRFNLKQYTNNILYQLESMCGLITSPAAFEKYGEAKIHTYPVGTGPFKFESFTPDVEIKYKRNDDYWGGKPYLDGIKYIFIKDDMAKSAAMQTGEVDVIMRVNTETGVALTG